MFISSVIELAANSRRANVGGFDAQTTGEIDHGPRHKNHRNEDSLRGFDDA